MKKVLATFVISLLTAMVILSGTAFAAKYDIVIPMDETPQPAKSDMVVARMEFICSNINGSIGTKDENVSIKCKLARKVVGSNGLVDFENKMIPAKYAELFMTTAKISCTASDIVAAMTAVETQMAKDEAVEQE